MNCKNYHFQELCFSKMSNVLNISSSFGNPHLLLILAKQYLAIIVRSGYDDIASCPPKPLCSRYNVVVTSLYAKHLCVSANLTIYIVLICVAVGQKRTRVKTISSDQCAYVF